ncbi:ABC transporter permease [Rhodoferax antarcticus]|uniref:Binding--dependent transport system inner membrane component family protein n=1 Tax=Rhodoferax antarcticus ANT.BR TaxID=1111071 RepID=A0A1Q8YHC5_9BURK|nr:ABC transporter permease [Rhodoferax antarcticus]MCW2310888.1 NitT/TauT family transport system permease protein [Rhodoferax antarcticus]OLP07396.1 binding--dependent transport system inner membrane component family protein [Rhodoferax antarcticus ANT.BR]
MTKPASLMQQMQHRALPVLVIALFILIAWYLGAIWMNAAGAIERVLPSDAPWTWQQLVAATMEMQRPVLPAPHQVALDFWSSLVDWPIDSPRNLLFHVAVTAESTLWGFVLGTLLGLVLAVLIVHSRTLDRALLPWIVASQTVPVLAIAPIVLVILGSLGFSGVAPKAVIAMYLCFFPVTVAMVQGLRSPQKIETEMLHTYAASRWQALWLLRLPASLPFLFPALRVGIAAGLVGAMVAELPTGAVAGLGARLLTGSYYGNTVQIWSALVMSALLGLALTMAVAGVEKLVLSRRGGQA